MEEHSFNSHPEVKYVFRGVEEPLAEDSWRRFFRGACAIGMVAVALAVLGGVSLRRESAIDSSQGVPLTALARDSPLSLATWTGNRLLILSYRGMVSIFTAGSGDDPVQFQAQPTNCGALSPDGRLVALGVYQTGVGLWDSASGRILLRLPQPKESRCLGFSADGSLLAAGAADGSITLWRTTDWRQTARLSSGTAAVRALTFSPNKPEFAVGDAAGEVRIWDLNTRSSRLVGTCKGTVRCLSYNPSGSMLAAASSWQPGLDIWIAAGSHRSVQAGSHRSLRLPESRGTTCLAFSPDGARIAAGTVDGHLVLWDLDDWQVVAEQPESGFADGSGTDLPDDFCDGGSMLAIAFQPDSTTVQAVYLDRMLRIFKINPASSGFHLTI